MLRILLWCFIVIISVPIVWIIVNKVFNVIQNELSDEKKKDASDVIGEIKSEQDRFEKEAKEREDEAKRAQEQSKALDNFLKGYHSEEDKEEK